MGYAVYQVGQRWGGYGIPAYCEQPECNEEIDRGMAFACGGEPFSEMGCDRYFCSKHKQYTCWKRDGSEEQCDHEKKCKCECFEVCERCSKNESPFPYKPEHPDWVNHYLKDGSWATNRKNNPDKVKEFKVLQANPYKP